MWKLHKRTCWSETLRCLKRYRMQKIKFLTDAAIAEIVRLARRIHEQI